MNRLQSGKQYRRQNNNHNNNNQHLNQRESADFPVSRKHFHGWFNCNSARPGGKPVFLNCGGKRSATPLFIRMRRVEIRRPAVYPKAPSPPRSAGAVQNVLGNGGAGEKISRTSAMLNSAHASKAVLVIGLVRKIRAAQRTPRTRSAAAPTATPQNSICAGCRPGWICSRGLAIRRSIPV